MFSPESVDGGWESVHQRPHKGELAQEDRWRYRRWSKHPNDPGWETGTYRSCHDALRKKVQPGDIVLDTVYPQGIIGNKPIVRSAFVVDDISNDVLHFDSFVFLDGNRDEGIRGKDTKGSSSLEQKEIREYISKLEASEAYNQYSSSDQPSSMSNALWERMLKEAGTHSSCSSGDDDPICVDSDSGIC